jgi:hypothetical protein
MSKTPLSDANEVDLNKDFSTRVLPNGRREVVTKYVPAHIARHLETMVYDYLTTTATEANEARGHIADQIQGWLDWQELRAGKTLLDDHSVMSVLVWPSRGQLKNWIRAIRCRSSMLPRDITNHSLQTLAFVPLEKDKTIELVTKWNAHRYPENQYEAGLNNGRHECAADLLEATLAKPKFGGSKDASETEKPASSKEKL